MSTHHPSHRIIALVVALFVLLVVGSSAAVAQAACGVVVPSSPVSVPAALT